MLRLVLNCSESDLEISNGVLIDGTRASGRVVVPEGVTRISTSAFRGNRNLTELVLPSSLRAIGTGAFMDCDSLLRVDIPRNVVSIGRGAFLDCRHLEEVTLPESIRDLSILSFRNTPWWNSYVKSGPRTNGMLIIGRVVMDAKRCRGKIIIPEGITQIAESAFLGSDITGIVFPKSIQNIDSQAFLFCNNLKDVVLPVVPGVSPSLADFPSSITSIRFSESDPIFIRDYSRIRDFAGKYGLAYTALIDKSYDLDIPLTVKCPLFELALLDNPENSKLKGYVLDNLQDFMQEAVRYGDLEFIEFVLQQDDSVEISSQALDKFLEYAARNKAHSVAALLMNYKNKHYGFRNTESEEDLL